MRSIRSLSTLLALTASLLFAAQAQAVFFTFAGKFTSNRGKIINIPVVGNTALRAAHDHVEIQPGADDAGTRDGRFRRSSAAPIRSRRSRSMTGFVGFPATTMVAGISSASKHLPGKKILQTTRYGRRAWSAAAFVFPNKVFSSRFRRTCERWR